MNCRVIVIFLLIAGVRLPLYAEKILVVQGRKVDGKMNVDAMVIPKPKDSRERYTSGNKYKVITYSRFGFKQAERTFDWRHYPASQNCEKGTANCSPYPAYSAFFVDFQNFKNAVKIKIFEDDKLIKEMPIDFDPAYLRMEESH